MPVVRAGVFEVYHPEATAALKQQWPDYEEWILSPHLPFDYATYIREAWQGLEDLVIVEHDVIPPPCAVPALLACAAEWCSHPVSLGNHYSSHTLGLVRFSCSLQRRHPDLAAQALPGPGSGLKQVHWRSVDSALIRVLQFRGVPVHPHYPPAEHLHRYPGSPPAGQAPATPGRPA